MERGEFGSAEAEHHRIAVEAEHHKTAEVHHMTAVIVDSVRILHHIPEAEDHRDIRWIHHRPVDSPAEVGAAVAHRQIDPSTHHKWM